jgi:hypothetical protein
MRDGVQGRMYIPFWEIKLNFIEDWNIGKERPFWVTFLGCCKKVTRRGAKPISHKY